MKYMKAIRSQEHAVKLLSAERGFKHTEGFFLVSNLIKICQKLLPDKPQCSGRSVVEDYLAPTCCMQKMFQVKGGFADLFFVSAVLLPQLCLFILFCICRFSRCGVPLPGQLGRGG